MKIFELLKIKVSFTSPILNMPTILKSLAISTLIHTNNANTSILQNVSVRSPYYPNGTKYLNPVLFNRYLNSRIICCHVLAENTQLHCLIVWWCCWQFLRWLHVEYRLSQSKAASSYSYAIIMREVFTPVLLPNHFLTDCLSICHLFFCYNCCKYSLLEHF